MAANTICSFNNDKPCPVILCYENVVNERLLVLSVNIRCNTSIYCSVKHSFQASLYFKAEKRIFIMGFL